MLFKYYKILLKVKKSVQQKFDWAELNEFFMENLMGIFSAFLLFNETFS